MIIIKHYHISPPFPEQPNYHPFRRSQITINYGAAKLPSITAQPNYHQFRRSQITINYGAATLPSFTQSTSI